MELLLVIGFLILGLLFLLKQIPSMVLVLPILSIITLEGETTPVAIIFLLLGFVLLIKGADFLVEGASAIAKKFGISDIIIGLTVVSMGTSAPELVVSINAAIDGNTGIVFGNVIGSNIANTCLILGIAGLIYPLIVQRNTAFIELPISLLIIVAVFILSNDENILGSSQSFLGRIDGILLLIGFIAFLIYVFRSAKNEPDTKEIIKPMPAWKSTLFIAGGLAGLIVGGNAVVDNAVFIANTMGMSERLIGLTIIAVGTSLPELATSAIAAYKKNSDIAIGNVIGSNIFNVLFVLAASAIIKPTIYKTETNWDLYFLMAVTVLLFIFLFIGTRRKGNHFTLDRWQSGILVAVILMYYSYLVITDTGV